MLFVCRCHCRLFGLGRLDNCGDFLRCLLGFLLLDESLLDRLDHNLVDFQLEPRRHFHVQSARLVRVAHDESRLGRQAAALDFTQRHQSRFAWERRSLSRSVGLGHAKITRISFLGSFCFGRTWIDAGRLVNWQGTA